MRTLHPVSAEIDVIVATRDRPGPLAACLEALVGQTFRGFRSIVVDDGSRVPVADGLPPALGDSTVIVRNESSLGPAASRNRGVAVGEARYLVFLDDDARAHPELLERHYAVLARHPDPVVSIGPVLAPVAGGLAPWNLWEADRLMREYARLGRGEASPSWTHLYAGNFAARRADVVAVGGFEEGLARQEDIELGYRLSELGCRFVFEPGAVAWHETERSLADWLRIPAASAQNDVLIDRLRANSGRLHSVRAALGERQWMLRVARRAFRLPTASRLAVRLATAAGRALYAVGARRLALPAFSLVWDLEYNRALAEATDPDPQVHT